MATFSENRIVYEKTVRGGGMFSLVVKKGRTLRITDTEGGANVPLLAYNYNERSDRYNMPDTLKAQHTFKLTKGNVLYTDMGRILFSITEDTVGWHESVCGVTNAKSTKERYGQGDFQKKRNQFYRNGYDNFGIELNKWGLTKKDLVANLNVFAKVTTDDEGAMTYATENSKAGDYIDLRAEMNVLVIMNTCPHPLDDRSTYAPKPVQLTVWESGEVPADDFCRTSRPENERGFINTETYMMLTGN